MNLAELLAVLINKTIQNKVIWDDCEEGRWFRTKINIQEEKTAIIDLKRYHSGDQTTVMIGGTGGSVCYLREVFRDGEPGSEMVLELFQLAGIQYANAEQDRIDAGIQRVINAVKEL